MRGDQRGHALAAREFIERLEHELRRVGIEIPGRLVGQHDRRLIDQRARDGDALLLAAGELRGLVVNAVLEAERNEQALRLRACAAPMRAGDHRRQGHVVERIELGQEMMKLVDETDLRAAQLGAFAVSKLPGGDAGDEHLPIAWPLKQAGRMQQGGFARAGRPDEADDLPRVQFKVHAVQHVQFVIAGCEPAPQAA